MSEQGPGNAEPLTLTAGKVYTTLVDNGPEPLRKLRYKVGRGKPASVQALLLACILITPAQILQHGAAEECILLKHNAHGPSYSIE